MLQHSEKALLSPLWETAVPDISPRSQLYSLTPLGLNSPFVESLASYVCRLACEHHVEVGKLIGHIIAPVISKQYIADSQSRNISSFLRYATPINGNGVMASDWTKALAQLTFRSDLSQLTLLISADALSQRDLLRTVKQWCSVCYDDWRYQGNIIYEPLLWFINGVTVCTKHSRLLEDHCPYCSSYLPWLSWNARPGYCSNCGNWLGSCEESSSSQPAERDIYVTETVGNFLTSIPQLSHPIPQTGFTQLLQNLISITTEGNIAAFSRCLGLPKTTMWELVQGRFPPSLPLLFQLCFQFRLPLLSLLVGEEDVIPVKNSDLFAKRVVRRGSRGLFNGEEVQQKLENILADLQCSSLSMRKVAQQLGYPVKTISTHFPELCQKISYRYAEYRKQRGVLRKAQQQQRIYEAAYVVHSQKLNPTYRRVGDILGKPGCFREKEARRVLMDIRYQIDHGSTRMSIEDCGDDTK